MKKDGRLYLSWCDSLPCIWCDNASGLNTTALTRGRSSKNSRDAGEDSSKRKCVHMCMTSKI